MTKQIMWRLLIIKLFFNRVWACFLNNILNSGSTCHSTYKLVQGEAKEN